MTSMVIVLIIKALVSPHTPPTAYIAVIFQGVTGALIYRLIPNLLIGSLLFFILGLIESAIQRLLLMTILYGKSLWEAIDNWGKMITQKWGVMLSVTSSELLIYIYLGIHLVTGIIMAILTYRIILSVEKHWGEADYQLQLSASDRKDFIRQHDRKRRPWFKYFIAVGLVLIMIIAYQFLGATGNAWKQALLILLRVVTILVVWYLVVAPVLIRLFQAFLRKRQQQLASEVSQTMDMIPQILWIIDKAWKETKGHSFSSAGNPLR